MADSHSSGDYSDVVSRRKFVSLAGTTGAAAVAGCLGDDDGDGDDDDSGDESGSDDESMDVGPGEDQEAGADSGSDGPAEPTYEDESVWFRTASTSFPPDQFQYNAHVGWFIPHADFGLYRRYGHYLNAIDEWRPGLIEDWEHTDDNSFVITIDDSHTWGSTGDPVDADSVILGLEIQESLGAALWDFIDDATATGDFEVTIDYPSDTRQDFVTYSVLALAADTPPSVFEGEEDNDDPAGLDMPEPDPSGFIALTDTTNNFHQFEPRDGLDDWADDESAADHVNWNGYRVAYRADNNAAHQSFIASELDGIHSLFVNPNTLSQFPDSVRQFQIPGRFGMGIWPDHSDEPWSIREVRQAFYYALDREAIVANVGESTKVSHHPTPTGLTWAVVEQYLGSTDPEGFNTYSFDQDQAESLLDDAGYEPSDISASLAYPQGWSDWAVAAQSAIDQLQNGGWDIDGDARSGGPGGFADELGDSLDLACDQHTPGGDPTQNIPYFSLLYKLRNQNFSQRNSNSHFANYTENEVEVNGSTVNIDDTFDALQTASEDERGDLIRDLALVFNKEVVCYHLMEKYEQSFIDESRFDIPDNHEGFTVFWPLWYLPQVEEKLDSATEADTDGLLKANGN